MFTLEPNNGTISVSVNNHFAAEQTTQEKIGDTLPYKFCAICCAAVSVCNCKWTVLKLWL